MDTIHDFVALRDQFRELKARVDRHFESAAGEDLPAMLSDKSVAETFLTHPNRLRRIAAVWAVSERHPVDVKAIELIKTVVTDDPDVEVRAVAVGSFGRILYQTSDAEMGRFISALVLNGSEHLAVREAAYRTLFALAGIPVQQQPPIIGFNLLKDADWTFVKRFCG